MGTTLSKGYKKPATGDRGSSFFLDLESNIELSNSHNHNGVNGEKVNVKDLVMQSQTISSTAWGSDLGGSLYRQLITLPTGLLFDDILVKFQVSSATGAVIFPTVTKVSSTTYNCEVNDNTIAILATYV